MLEIPVLVVLIPALPLLAAVATAALGPRVLGRRSHWPTIAALALSAVLSAMLVAEVRRADRIARWQHQTIGGAPKEPSYVGYERIVTLWSWADLRGAFAPATSGPRAAAGDETPRAGETAAARRPLDIRVALRADGLSSLMLVVVTTVSLIVAVYSIGYMRGDRGYWRFFAYLSLFVFSMTMLVSVSNFLLLYVFWEAVGLCSYLLIGFWYEKPAAAAAGKKAFLVNRVGDFGFALGVFLLWTTYGTLNFHDTPQADAPAGSAAPAWTAMAPGGEPGVASPSGAPGTSNPRGAPGAVAATNAPEGSFVPGILGKFAAANPGFHTGGAVGLAICLLLLLGACGKSAQFPLHVWLPDAMEGPTPVSALIHAATMVAAGVYMLCRVFFLLNAPALLVIAWMGGFTALLAALIAVQQNDIKRILAYSTLSQLGYMVMAVGLGGPTPAMFHLATHASFKALLFLGAGAVIHALHHEQDIWRMGGLKAKMPATYWTFLVATLALCGVPPFSGFYSKDEILAVAAEHNPLLFALGVGVAALTTFYMFRLVFVAFLGDAKSEAASHAHEAPSVMKWPLVALAIPALLSGLWGINTFLDRQFHPGATAHSGWRLEKLFAPFEHSPLAALGGVGAFLFAFFTAKACYQQAQSDPIPEKLGVLATAMRNRFYFDELYRGLIAATHELLARLADWFDRWIIAGLGIRGLHGTTELAGRALRLVQTGSLQTYAFLVVLGVVIVMVFALKG